MTTHERQQKASDVLAERVEELRLRRGLNARQVAERCAAAGAPEITHEVLYNIKTGRRDEQGRRRRDLTVDEFLALAVALDVAPVHLLVPTTDDAPFPVSSTRTELSKAVRGWIRGSAPLPGMNEALFAAEKPEGEASAFVLTTPMSETLSAIQHDLAELRRNPRLAWTEGDDG